MGVSDRWRKFNYQYLITTVPTQPFLYSISSRVISSIVRRCLENVSVVSQTSKFLHSFFYYLPDSWDFFPSMIMTRCWKIFLQTKCRVKYDIEWNFEDIFSPYNCWGNLMSLLMVTLPLFLFHTKWNKIERGCNNHLSYKIKYIKHKVLFVKKKKKNVELISLILC